MLGVDIGYCIYLLGIVQKYTLKGIVLIFTNRANNSPIFTNYVKFEH